MNSYPILGEKIFIICQKKKNKFSIIHRINIWKRNHFLLICEQLKKVEDHVLNFFLEKDHSNLIK